MLIIILVLCLDEMATFLLLNISSCSTIFPSSPNSSKREFAYLNLFFQSFWRQDDVLCVPYSLNMVDFPPAWARLILKILLHTSSSLHLLELSGRGVKYQDSAPFQWFWSLKNAISRFLNLWEVGRYILINPHICSLCIRACPVLVLFCTFVWIPVQMIIKGLSKQGLDISIQSFQRRFALVYWHGQRIRVYSGLSFLWGWGRCE